MGKAAKALGEKLGVIVSVLTACVIILTAAMSYQALASTVDTHSKSIDKVSNRVDGLEHHLVDHDVKFQKIIDAVNDLRCAQLGHACGIERLSEASQ